MSVLELSHMWAFTALREHAINRLDTSDLTAIRRVQLAKKYDIPEWIPKAYTELVNREKWLTDEEAEELGSETAFEISRYREQKLRQMVDHFKAGHDSDRVCESGHDNSISSRCRKTSCWGVIKIDIRDGCEIFDVPGAPSRKILRMY